MPDPRARPLRRDDLDPDPLRQFAAWLEEARGSGADLTEAVALATASPHGRPSVRMVLLKRADERGFTFFSGYEGRKGEELAANPHAALCFYWHGLGRQVRVEGDVTRLPSAESDAYFESRPGGARLSAAAASQGEIVSGRAELEQRVEALRSRYPNEDPPRPSHWGGYVLVPAEYEFWQHREDRLHDRFRYRRERGAWIVERLAP